MGCLSPSKSESTQTSESKTPGQKKVLQQALDIYGPQLGVNENVFQGDTVAPFSELQNRAVAGAGNIADDFLTTPQRAGTPLKGEVESTTSDFLAGRRGAEKIDPGDFFERSIANPANRRLREEVIPGIDEDFSGPGFFNAARSQGRAEARQDTAEFLDESQANFDLSIAQFNAGLDESKAGRAQAAIPQGLAVGQVPATEIKNNLDIAAKQLGSIGAIFGFGQAEQTQEQVELQDEILRFAEENQITDPENLAIIMSLLNLNFSSSSGSRSSGGAGLGFQFASAAAGGAGGNLGKQFFA